MSFRFNKLSPILALDEHDPSDALYCNYYFWCEGCKEAHGFRVAAPGKEEKCRELKIPIWTFDGNVDKPTFAPSLLYMPPHARCHLFLREGVVEFLSDCVHALAGQKRPLTRYPFDETGN